MIHALGKIGDAGSQLIELVFGQGDWGPSSRPLRLFEATYRSLRATAPVTMAIDDLQWVDDLSLALISYLLSAAEADRLPVALLAAGRPSAPVGALRGSLAQILRDDPLRAKIELQSLQREAGVALVRSLVPPIPTQRAEEVWRAAAGSPFWIVALSTDREAGGTGPTPAPAQRRCGELSAGTRSHRPPGGAGRGGGAAGLAGSAHPPRGPGAWQSWDRGRPRRARPDLARSNPR